MVMDVREKLVELLDEAEEWADCKCDELGCESCPADKMKGDCVQQLMVDRLIAHGVTVQEWISVNDRLPEYDQVVLCYKDDRGVRIGKHMPATYADGVVAFKDLARDYAFGATHWMPLPKPPKGE